MMGKNVISELPPNTVKLITATQIATSVSNIIKELIENSLDAGSTVVRVKLENFGLTKIEVTDNGSGVSKENVFKMALPHYTSKISQHQDIETLTTYGFRGEALAAICAVAKLSVTTKTAEDPVASTYTMDNSGNVVDVKPSHLSQGTLIVTTSLFWNVPVRKQFYTAPKRKKDEMVKVEDLLLSYGLIHPELHLSLHHEHSLVWQKNRAADLKANILQTLGHSICSNMEFISVDETIDMFLMVPKKSAPLDVCFRHRPDRCFTFINHRPVTSKDIEKLMKELYGFVQDANQKSTMYPIFIVSLQFPGHEVDVNLEPNKSQVLMKRHGDVLELIRTKVGHVIGNDPAHSNNYTETDPQTESFVDNSLMSYTKETEEVAIVEETIVDPRCETLDDSHLHSLSETRLESQLESRIDTLNRDALEDDDLFHGFNEPFEMELQKRNEKIAPDCYEPVVVPIGSDQWSRGLATASDGRIVHPIEVLRGEPHMAKRLCDLPLSGNLPKKPKLIEAQEASKIVGSSPSLLETVNGKVRKIPADPFGEYCKEMRNELLSQDPLMSFTELSQNLSNGWKNLDKKSREKYENKAEVNKQRYNYNKLKTPRKAPMSNTSLDRFLLGVQSPVPRTPKNPANSSFQLSSPPSKRASLDIEFSLDILDLSLNSAMSLPKNQWYCLKKLDDGGWLFSNSQEIMAVNFTRLYELILYSTLASEHVIPSRPAKSPFLIDKKILGDSEAWTRLMRLPTERETTTTRTITDLRIVANGLAVRLGVDSDEAGLVVYRVPANVNSFELNDAKNLLLKVGEENSTVESCRLEQALTSLKFEAARLASERCTEPDPSEVSQLLERWLSTNPENVCLHGQSVVWNYLIGEIPLDNEN